MSPTAISLMMALAFAGFAWLAWRKLSIVAALSPENRVDQPLARLRSVLINGFLQQRMLRREWRAGLMHALIFFGFMALLLRKLHLIAIGFDEAASFPDAFGGPFAAFKDAIELVVIAAVVYALWRRLVLHPPRLERNREALVVLALILAIMLSDFAFDAFRFTQLASSWPAVAHERDWAFVGAALANFTSTLTPETLRLGYHGFYWLQMATVFSFLVLLPAGEHFHIVTALPALYFRRGRPGQRVPTVDLDALMNASDESQMKAGVRTALDLSWKRGLDAFTCTECGRCKDACPTHLTGKPLSLKAVNDSLKHHLQGERERILRGDPQHELPPLIGGVISDDTLWACTSCGYCEAACPIELEHLDSFFQMRQHQVMIEGAFPHELKKASRPGSRRATPGACPPSSAATGRKGWACRWCATLRTWPGLSCSFTSARP